MVTYEELTHILIKSAKEAGLKAFNIKNMINTITCDREFSFLMVPAECENPEPLRAEISFHWDSAMTAQTVYGVSYPDNELDQTAELQIKYSFEADSNIDEVNVQLNEVFQTVMQHDNIPAIRWQLIVSNEGEKKITSIWAVHYWDVNLESDVNVRSNFKEVYDVLKGMERLAFLRR